MYAFTVHYADLPVNRSIYAEYLGSVLRVVVSEFENLHNQRASLSHIIPSSWCTIITWISASASPSKNCRFIITDMSRIIYGVLEPKHKSLYGPILLINRYKAIRVVPVFPLTKKMMHKHPLTSWLQRLIRSYVLVDTLSICGILNHDDSILSSLLRLNLSTCSLHCGCYVTVY